MEKPLTSHAVDNRKVLLGSDLNKPLPCMKLHHNNGKICPLKCHFAHQKRANKDASVAFSSAADCGRFAARRPLPLWRSMPRAERVAYGLRFAVFSLRFSVLRHRWINIQQGCRRDAGATAQINPVENFRQDQHDLT